MQCAINSSKSGCSDFGQQFLEQIDAQLSLRKRFLPRFDGNERKITAKTG